MKSQHPYGPRNWHFQLRRSNLITRARTLKLKLATIPAWFRKQKFFDTRYLRGKRQCRLRWARFRRQGVKRRRQCKDRQQTQPSQSLAENGFEDSEDEENWRASWIKIPVENNSHALDRSKSRGKLVTANAATVVPTPKTKHCVLSNARCPKTEFMANDGWRSPNTK